MTTDWTRISPADPLERANSPTGERSNAALSPVPSGLVSGARSKNFSHGAMAADSKLPTAIW